jgi:hypothetical protein
VSTNGKKAMLTKPTETAPIIKSKCLKVESAIILLKSYSKLVPNAAIIIVRPETRRRNTHNQLLKLDVNELISKRQK